MNMMMIIISLWMCAVCIFISGSVSPTPEIDLNYVHLESNERIYVKGLDPLFLGARKKTFIRSPPIYNLFEN